jgi:hypothetical protein
MRIQRKGETDLKRIRIFAMDHHCLLYRDNSEKKSKRRIVFSAASDVQQISPAG